MRGLFWDLHLAQGRAALALDLPPAFQVVVLPLTEDRGFTLGGGDRLVRDLHLAVGAGYLFHGSQIFFGCRG